MHPELQALHEADREDHACELMAGTPEYAAMRARDAQRRARARAILDALPDAAPVDLYRAAWIFNHGDTPEDARFAHDLATRAAAGGHAPARWLAAAAFDRWCMYRGLPQRYGTQIVPDGVGYRVWDTEPAVTDAERAEHDVPPLAEMQRRAAECGLNHPQPPLDQAPDWLKTALNRWAVRSSGRVDRSEPGH